MGKITIENSLTPRYMMGEFGGMTKYAIADSDDCQKKTQTLEQLVKAADAINKISDKDAEIADGIAEVKALLTRLLGRAAYLHKANK